MTKYDSAMILIKRKARFDYLCDYCKKSNINSGDFYYSCELNKIHSPHFKRRKFCEKCYGQYGDNLLKQ